MTEEEKKPMEEKEIINIIKNEIVNTYAERKAEALQGILDLYNKEKQKIKELENADLTTVYMNGFYDGEKKWKDKINKTLDDYTEKSKNPLVNAQSRREYTFGIRVLQELLEE